VTVMHKGVTMPKFWRPQPSGMALVLSLLLAPVGLLYAFIVNIRLAISKPKPTGSIVICVGNAVVGGTGKTPVCLALGDQAIKKGMNIHYLTRGYGGTVEGPVLVDPDRHTANDVGDEALLLAVVAPTWVAKSRGEGAARAAAEGAELIVMDDGLQNPSVRKSYTLLVVDGSFAFGNGLPMPAGPLREFLGCAFARSNRCLIVGEDRNSVAAGIEEKLPVSRMELRPVDDLSSLAGMNLVAFAGIGHPEKFFDTLRKAGLAIMETAGFSDHHVYNDAELTVLQRLAERHQATLVTTTKDFVRLPDDFKKKVRTVAVEPCFTDGSDWAAILDEAMKHG